MKPGYRIIEERELSGLGDPVIVTTFLRSGTHLTIDLLRRQFAAFGSWKRPLETLDSLYLPLDVLLPGWEPSDWSTARVLDVLRRPRRPVLKTHFLEADLSNLRREQPAVADWIERRGKFLHVARDPRKVLSSLWAFLPDWQGGAAVPFDESFVREWAAKLQTHGERWTRRPGVRTVTYEAIVGEPESCLRQLGDWLDESPLWRQPILPRPLRSRWESRWMRLIAWQSESTAILASRSSPPWDPTWDALLSTCPSPQSCPGSSN